VNTEIRTINPDDSELLGQVHAQCFEEPWTTDAFRTLLGDAATFGFAAGADAFVLCRTAADEAEVLTLCTVPGARRRALARGLVHAAMAEAATRGATRLFLEVAETNVPALSLYAQLGFEIVAKRAGYYETRAGSGVAALVMRKDLAGR